MARKERMSFSTKLPIYVVQIKIVKEWRHFYNRTKHQHRVSKDIDTYYDAEVQEYSARVEKLEGKVISQKMPVPVMGYFAVCAETENNGFGIFEVDETAK